MRRLQAVLAFTGLFVVFSSSARGITPSPTPTPTSEATETATIEDAIPEAEFKDVLDINPENFKDSTNIDNPWFALKPGTEYIYEGTTLDESGELKPHREVFIITDLIKVIDGVRTVVVFDRDYSDDELEEAELTFFAQDNDGNIWHFGEYVESYDESGFVGGLIWAVGVLDGAKAGIMMLAKPKLGSPSYSEGFAPPPFNWTDRGKVYDRGQKVSTSLDTYHNVLVIKEYNREEPGAFQLKYYARGVGQVQIGWGGDDETQEEMDLVDLVHLDSESLAEVRAQALELEQRAYLYARTAPAEPDPTK